MGMNKFSMESMVGNMNCLTNSFPVLELPNLEGKNIRCLVKLECQESNEYFFFFFNVSMPYILYGAYLY